MFYWQGLLVEHSKHSSSSAVWQFPAVKGRRTANQHSKCHESKGFGIATLMLNGRNGKDLVLLRESEHLLNPCYERGPEYCPLNHTCRSPNPDLDRYGTKNERDSALPHTMSKFAIMCFNGSACQSVCKSSFHIRICGVQCYSESYNEF